MKKFGREVAEFKNVGAISEKREAYVILKIRNLAHQKAPLRWTIEGLLAVWSDQT